MDKHLTFQSIGSWSLTVWWSLLNNSVPFRYNLHLSASFPLPRFSLRGCLRIWGLPCPHGWEEKGASSLKGSFGSSWPTYHLVFGGVMLAPPWNPGSQPYALYGPASSCLLRPLSFWLPAQHAQAMETRRATWAHLSGFISAKVLCPSCFMVHCLL